MALFKGELEEFLTYYESLRDYYKKILERCPDAKLRYQKDRGYDQFIYANVKDGKVVRKGINKREDIIRELAKAEFARRALNVIEADIEVLQNAVDGIINFDPDSILESMNYAYKQLPEEYFFDRNKTAISLNLSGADKARIERHKEWGDAPFTQSDYHPENKNVRTSRGELVRSKSELLIIEDLYRYEVPKHYEQVIETNGVRFIPDFTFEDANGELFFWDHFGMMDYPDYAEHNINKIERLNNAGIVLGDRLIVSFDRNGKINMGMIEAIIKNEVIPRL